MTRRRPRWQGLVKTGRAVCAAVVACLVAIVGFPVSAASQTAADMADIAIERYGGADRYSTSLLIAEAVSEDAGGALDWAVLVSGLRWTDAVVAAPVAGVLGAPLIMTPPDQLRADTARFLTRNGVSDVLIIGALDSVSGRRSVIGSRVVDGLRELGIGVERVTGDDEYDTAVAAAAYLDQILRRRPEGSGPAGVMPGKGRTAIVANGHVFADALVAGPIAAHGRHPLLLTTPDRLHHQVSAYLRNAAVEHVVLMGGTAALSESVESSLRALGLDITRLAGATRFDTAVQAAQLANGRYASGKDACFGSRDIGIARARVPFDSFSAGPLLARLCAPLVLAEPTRVPDATADWLDDVRATAQRDGIGSVGLRVFGGQAAVSDAALSSYLAATRLQVSAPDAPNRPSLSGGDGTVTASWQVPPSNGEPITAQQVRWRADGSWSSQQLIATATSYTISGLRDGTSYEVQVRARNSVGWGPWSAVAGTATQEQVSAPDAPGGVSAGGGDGSVTVSWRVPSGNGAAITEQQVRWTPHGMTWDTATASVSASATSYTISGLRDGTSYEVQVRARNSEGWGPWSAAAVATTPQGSAEVFDITLREGVHAWSVPVWYCVNQNGLGADANGYLQDEVANLNQYVAPFFKDQTSGRLVLTFVAGQVVSPSKALNWNEPFRSGPGAVSAVCLNTARDEAEADDHDYLYVLVDQPGGGGWSGLSCVACIGYRGLWGGAQPSKAHRTNPISYWYDSAAHELGHGILGLCHPDDRPAQARDYGCDARHLQIATEPLLHPIQEGDGWVRDLVDSAHFDKCTLMTVCKAVHWWPNAWPVHDPSREFNTIINYASRGYPWISCGQRRLLGVLPGPDTPYGPCPSGAGPSQVPDAPGAPSVSGGDGSVAVSWLVPSGNGLAITEQLVRWRAGGSWSSPRSVGAAATSYTIAGLRDGTSYEVQVRARNSVGWGPWSTAATAATDRAGP